MSMKKIHQLLIPYFREQGVDITDLTLEEMRKKYPRSARLGDLVEKYMDSKQDDKDIPVTTLSIAIAEKIENCRSRLEMELIFIESAFSIQELYIKAFQKVSNLSDEEAERYRETYREEVETKVRPALQKALDEFFIS